MTVAAMLRIAVVTDRYNSDFEFVMFGIPLFHFVSLHSSINCAIDCWRLLRSSETAFFITSYSESESGQASRERSLFRPMNNVNAVSAMLYTFEISSIIAPSVRSSGEADCICPHKNSLP